MAFWTRLFGKRSSSNAAVADIQQGVGTKGRGPHPASQVQERSEPTPSESPNLVTQKSLDEKLLTAAQKGTCEEMKGLLAAGADRDCKDRYGRTPLISAAHEGHLDVVKLLLDAGADIEARSSDSKQRSPLGAAAEKGHLEVVQTLLRAGANIEAGSGHSPLHLACSKGRLEVVEALLTAGANIEAESISDGRPLHIAAENGRTAVAKMLLHHGADVHALRETTSGHTALQIAVGNGDVPTIKLLLEADRDSPSVKDLMLYVHKGSAPVIPILVEAGADIEVRDPSGNSLLHRCICDSNVPRVQELLEARARVDDRAITAAEVAIRQARARHTKALEGVPLDPDHRRQFFFYMTGGERDEIDGAYVADAERILVLLKRAQSSTQVRQAELQNLIDKGAVPDVSAVPTLN